MLTLLFETSQNAAILLENFGKLCENFTLHGEKDYFIHLFKASEFELYHLVC